MTIAYRAPSGNASQGTNGHEMFGYYLNLALRGLRRNPILTALVIVAIGIGIGASMTTLTILRAMAGDPLPQKARQLFAPQIDNWGPVNGSGPGGAQTDDRLPDELTYMDATALMRAHVARRRAAMVEMQLSLIPADPRQPAFEIPVRATYADFFAMFDVPFLYGGPWSASDDAAHAPRVVITRALNDRLFGGADSRGRTMRFGAQDYVVVGVIDDWDPTPRFYDLGFNTFGDSEQAFMPFTNAIDDQAAHIGIRVSCGRNTIGAGLQGLLRTECVWIQFWVELPTAADVRHYRQFLLNYAADQRQSGRFDWPPRIALRDLPQWLDYHHVVDGEVRLLVGVSFGFLAVCLLNAMGLLLAKFLARSGSLGVRRALGAAHGAVFAQCLMEAAMIGLGGGLLGLALTRIGLASSTALLPETSAALTRLSGTDVAIAVMLAIGATLVAGLYPTWRAAQVQPIRHLKAP